MTDATPAREGRPAGGAFVMLVPRDPDWALALWQLSAEAIGRARGQLAPPLAQAEMQLRVYPVGERGPGRRRPVRTYRISRWSGQRLVLLERPGVAHQAAIGFLDVQGAFVPVARSVIVATPRGGIGPAGPGALEHPEDE